MDFGGFPIKWEGINEQKEVKKEEEKETQMERGKEEGENKNGTLLRRRRRKRREYEIGRKRTNKGTFLKKCRNI